MTSVVIYSFSITVTYLLICSAETKSVWFIFSGSFPVLSAHQSDWWSDACCLLVSGCQTAWDDIRCWHRAEVGQVVSISCANVSQLFANNQGKSLQLTCDKKLTAHQSSYIRYILSFLMIGWCDLKLCVVNPQINWCIDLFHYLIFSYALFFLSLHAAVFLFFCLFVLQWNYFCWSYFLFGSAEMFILALLEAVERNE